MSIDKSEITIVMVSFFSKNLIEKPINSIDQNIKIIVIENSNSKECKDFLENKYKNVRVVMSEKNLGNGAGINLGLKLVKTKYAFYLDVDTEIYQGTIEKLLHVYPNLNSNWLITGIGYMSTQKEIKEVKFSRKIGKVVVFYDDNSFDEVNS